MAPNTAPSLGSLVSKPESTHQLARTKPKIAPKPVSSFPNPEPYLNLISGKSPEDALGPFVGDPNRFNVAITRAKCLMIVIGDERLLCQNGNWKFLIDYIKSKGGFKSA